MHLLRRRRSVVLAWALMPVVLWSGMPNTGCVCASGRIKLFCGHAATPVRHASCCDAQGCPPEAEHEADCCASGNCCRGADSAEHGIRSTTCCQPIDNAPGMAPKSVTMPLDQLPAIAVAAELVAMPVGTHYAIEAVGFDTGPPVDRVIVFRSLLI